MSKIGDKIKNLKNKAKRKARKAAIVGTAVLAVAGGTSCSNNGEKKSENTKENKEVVNKEKKNVAAGPVA